MGAGAAVFVLGYQLLLTGSLALILADRIPWSTVYFLLSGVMVIGLIATSPEPEDASASIISRCRLLLW